MVEADLSSARSDHVSERVQCDDKSNSISSQFMAHRAFFHRQQVNRSDNAVVFGISLQRTAGVVKLTTEVYIT